MDQFHPDQQKNEISNRTGTFHISFSCGPWIPDTTQVIWDIYNFWDVLKWIWDSPICVNRVRTCPKWWINLEHLFLQMTDFLITSIPYDVTWHVETKIDFFLIDFLKYVSKVLSKGIIVILYHLMKSRRVSGTSTI